MFRAIFLALAGLAVLFPAAVSLARAADSTVSVEVVRAEELYKDGKYREAIAVLDKYLADHPADVTALVDRGDDYEALSDQRAAIVDYTAALKINPDFAYAYASRCQSRYELDLPREALPDCTKAIELNPKLTYAYRERAVIELNTANLDGALADANASLKLGPDNPYGLVLRCRVYIARGNYPAALDDCNAAIAISPEAEEGYFHRGRVYIMQKQWSAAIADFQTTLKLDPQETGSFYWLALAKLNAGSYPDALTAADSYIKANGDDPDGHLVRAEIEAKLGNTGEAKTSATEALRHYRIENDQAGATQAQKLLDELNGAPAKGSQR